MTLTKLAKLVPDRETSLARIPSLKFEISNFDSLFYRIPQFHQNLLQFFYPSLDRGNTPGLLAVDLLTFSERDQKSTGSKPCMRIWHPHTMGLYNSSTYMSSSAIKLAWGSIHEWCFICSFFFNTRGYNMRNRIPLELLMLRQR